MGQKLPENEAELYKRIDEVLHYIWDPIGVAGSPEARDEYYSYLPQVFTLAKIKNNQSKITEYLKKIETESMCINNNKDRCNLAAEIIIDWSNLLLCNP